MSRRWSMGVVVAVALVACRDGAGDGKSGPPARPLGVQAAPPAQLATHALPSWKETPAKRAITSFVSAVTTRGSPNYLARSDRIAVFDNDGTLWVEQPLYVQLAFVLDRVRALAPKHPEWKSTQPFKSVLEGNGVPLEALNQQQAGVLLAATHSGTTTDEFAALAADWLREARHPRFSRKYTECVYAPMRELLDYLQSHGFSNYIVSAGGIDFMRVVSRELYGIPPDRVVGSSGRLRFEFRDGKAQLVKLPELGAIDDREEKPLNIQLHVGQRPILAFGNSDGDLQMLQYVAGQTRPNLVLLLHHDDAQREYAYDRSARVGKLDRALDEAREGGWTLVSMKSDWKRVFRSGS